MSNNSDKQNYLDNLRKTADQTGQNYEYLVALNQEYIDEQFEGRPVGDVKTTNYKKKMGLNKKGTGR